MGTNLKQLAEHNRSELVAAWIATLGTAPPPSTSQDMMRLIIGWEIQAKTSRPDVRALKTAINKLLKTRNSSDAQDVTIKPKIDLCAGTRLSRDWQGRTYTVDVLDKGYAYNGQLFTSLSPIAKAITGIHRSGPRFFGVSS